MTKEDKKDSVFSLVFKRADVSLKRGETENIMTVLKLIARRIWLHLRGQIVGPVLFVIILSVVIYLATIGGCYFGVEEWIWADGRGKFSCDRLLSSDLLHWLFSWSPVRME